MPILKYRCTDCGKEFAKILLNPGAVPKECPVCGAGGLEESGEAFEARGGSGQRAQCTSCEECSVEGCAPVSISS
jgi:putative FmdB family regulatory protein